MAYNSKVYKVITDKILELLKDGVIPWNKPWDASMGMPKNLVTKYPYRGINVIILSAMPYKSPWWLSYKQVKQLGGRIKDEELKRYTPVVFFKWFERDKPKDKSDNKDGDEDLSEESKNPKKRRFPVVRYYNVYNTDQCTGLDDKIPVVEARTDLNPIEECEKVVENMPQRPDIHHKGNRAFYSPSMDYIQLPVVKSFNSMEEYYSTKFHEMLHSTGHESRLNRAGIVENHFFGDEDYSKEELVAEMGASFLCAMTGIENRTIENSASYIQNWSKKLEDNEKWVVIAGAQAQKAVDFIMNRKKDN